MKPLHVSDLLPRLCEQYPLLGESLIKQILHHGLHSMAKAMMGYKTIHLQSSLYKVKLLIYMPNQRLRKRKISRRRSMLDFCIKQQYAASRMEFAREQKKKGNPKYAYVKDAQN